VTKEFVLKFHQQDSFPAHNIKKHFLRVVNVHMLIDHMKSAASFKQKMFSKSTIYTLTRNQSIILIDAHGLSLSNFEGIK